MTYPELEPDPEVELPTLAVLVGDVVWLFMRLDATDSAALTAADVAALTIVLFKPESSLETALVAALAAAEDALATSEEAALPTTQIGEFD